MACGRPVRHISFCHWGFFFPSLSRLLLLLRLGEGKGLRRTRDPNLTRDRWSSLSPPSPLPPLFPPLFPPLPIPPTSIFSSRRPWRTERPATFPDARGRGGLGVRFPSTMMFACVFERGVNIGVKRRGHADQQLQGRRRRETNYVHCAKAQKAR